MEVYRRKVVEVEAMQLEETMEIKIEGKTIIGKKHDWLVVDPDNSMQMLSDKAFQENYEKI